MANEARKNIAVGITAIAGIVGLLSLMVLFGYLPELFKSGYMVSVKLPSAEGLNPGNAVRLNGIHVGEVESVKLDQDVRKGATVVARISKPGLKLPTSVRAQLRSPLLGGGSKIELSVDSDDSQTPAPPTGGASQSAGVSQSDKPSNTPGANPQHPAPRTQDSGPKARGSGSGPQPQRFLATDGSAVIKGKAGGITQRITNELQAALAEPTRQFQELTATIKDFTHVWKKVGINVRKMTDPHTPSEVDAGKVVGNLASVVTRIDARLGQMKTTLTQLNKWVGDKQLRSNLKSTAKNMSSASKRIESAVGSLQKQATGLADDLSTMTGAAKSLMNKAQHGKGTLGKALTDPQLYNNLDDLAKQMRQAVDEVRLLVEKWKKEGLPIQF